MAFRKVHSRHLVLEPMCVMRGMIIVGKSYGLRDWTVTLAVTLGSTEFLMTGPTTSSSEEHNSIYGFAFLFAFLALDGLTSTMQEKLFKEHKVSKYNQMLTYADEYSARVTHAWMRVHTHTHPHPHTLRRTHTLTHTHIHTDIYTHAHVHTHTRARAHTHTHTCVGV